MRQVHITFACTREVYIIEENVLESKKKCHYQIYESHIQNHITV